MAPLIEVAHPTLLRRGPGQWRLNVSLLEHPEVGKIVKSCLTPRKGLQNGCHWTFFKSTVRSQLQKYSRRAASIRRRRETLLQDKLHQWTTRLLSHPRDQHALAKKSFIESQLASFEEKRIQFLRIRTQFIIYE